MTRSDIRQAADAASRAAAALIPLAAGGRDGDGRSVVDTAQAIRTARMALVEALGIIEDQEEKR